MKILYKAGIFVTIGVCVGAGWIYWNKSKQPTDFDSSSYDIFKNGEKVVLYSLEPQRKNTLTVKDSFRDYQVLGQVEVVDANLRSTLKSALIEGMNQNAIVAKCFNPRHGLRVSWGLKTIDLVICFECNSLEVYSPKQVSVLSVSNSAEPLFDRILRSARNTAVKPFSRSNS
jgi:hypothetical protein